MEWIKTTDIRPPINQEVCIKINLPYGQIRGSRTFVEHDDFIRDNVWWLCEDSDELNSWDGYLTKINFDINIEEFNQTMQQVNLELLKHKTLCHTTTN